MENTRNLQNRNIFPIAPTGSNKRTRSRLQLPEFRIELTRSPLKEAKNATRQKNMNKGARSALGQLSPLQQENREAGPERSNMFSEPSIDDEILLSPKKTQIVQSRKRIDPPSFDDEFDDAAQSNYSSAKRQKLLPSGTVTSGPLDAFFARPLMAVSTPKVENVIGTQDKHNTDASVRRAGGMMGQEPFSFPQVTVPQTPTLKQLKELQHLDMRTMTPSPKKIGSKFENNGTSSPTKSGLLIFGDRPIPKIDVPLETPKLCIERNELQANALMDSLLGLSPLSPPPSTPILARPDNVKQKLTASEAPVQTPAIPQPKATGNDDTKHLERAAQPHETSLSAGDSSEAVNTGTMIKNPEVKPDRVRMTRVVTRSLQRGAQHSSPSKRPNLFSSSNPHKAGMRTKVRALTKPSSIRAAVPRPTFIPKVADEKKGSSKSKPSMDVPAVRSPRKQFVLTVPSSLSPSKRASGISPCKPSTSLYPPPINDPTAKARSEKTLSNLSHLLKKLAMPPPTKPTSASSTDPREDRNSDKTRPSTSLGFSRDIGGPFNNPNHSDRPSHQNRLNPLGKKPPNIPPPPPFFDSTFDKSKSATLDRKPLGKGIFDVPRVSSVGQESFATSIARMKASRKTSLETVEGSPVKNMLSNPNQRSATTVGLENDDTSMQGESGTSQSAENHSLPLDATNCAVEQEDNTFGCAKENGQDRNDGSDSAQDQHKELKVISKLNASRRASMAFSALSHSLLSPDVAAYPGSSGNIQGSEQPSSANKPRSPNEIYRAPSSRPIRAAALRSFTSSSMNDPTRSKSQFAHKVSAESPNISEPDSETPAGDTKKKSATALSNLSCSLNVLKKCKIFVDIRSDEGEDAGALFVDMLRGLGAKVCSIS